MELSALDVVTALAEHGPALGVEVSVAAHEASKLPPGAGLVPVSLPDCPPTYANEGEGPRKWATVLGETRIQETLFGHARGFDLVHDHSHSATSAGACRFLGVPLVRTVRLMPYHPAYVSSAATDTHRIYISAYQREEDGWRGGRPSSVCYDRIPVSGRDGGEHVSERPFALSIGRVEPRKGHHVAAALARSAGLPLLVVGEVVQREYADALVGQGGVEVAGPVDREEVGRLLRAARLLLWFPTSREPSGRVVIESLRAGTGVVGRPSGVLHDFVRSGHAHPYKGADDALDRLGWRAGAVRAERLPEWWPQSAREVAAQHAGVYAGLLGTQRRV